MSLANLRRRHLKLLAKTHIRYSIRGGAGLVFTFLSLVTGLIIASIFIDPLKALADQLGGDPQEVMAEAVRAVSPAIKWALGTSSEQTHYLLVEKPAVVSAFLIVMMFVLPFLVSLGAFNQYAGDINNRGFRYLLLRTERVNIYLGRFIGTFLFTAVVLFLLVLIVSLYLVIQVEFYSAGDVILWMMRGYLMMLLFALPYVALCGWISSVIDSPFGAMAISQMVIGFWPMLVAMGRNVNDAVGYAGYAMPWGYKFMLFDANIAKVFAGAGAMLGFTALFVWLGLRNFSTRDL